MVDMALQERVATKKKKSHLHFWNFSANNNPETEPEAKIILFMA